MHFKLFQNIFIFLKIIEDINLWGLLWQIIVENVPLFYDQFSEHFSIQVLIQDCA